MADLFLEQGTYATFQISLDVAPEASWTIRARIGPGVGQHPIVDRAANVDPDERYIRIPWTDEDISSLEPGAYAYDVAVTATDGRVVSTAGTLRVV